MIEKVEERVRKGAAFLDGQRPGWAKDIDLPTLNIAQVGRCVIGQLYGNYWHGLRTLGINTTIGEDFGFDTLLGGEGETMDNLWKEEITKRRSISYINYEPESAGKTQVTLAQIQNAKSHIENVAKHSPSYVPDLTTSGVLFHILMDLGIELEVE